MAFPLQGDDTCQSIAPTPLPEPYWVGFSSLLGQELGIALNESGLPADPLWLDVLSGNTLATKEHAFSNPIATAYSGHQFGIWAGQLGDGRAILLGDIGPYEIQLKGSGITCYSRMGDGRAVLRSSIREFLASEAMHALGVPTSRALAVTGSKKPVMRETLETAAVCTRLAPSFLRVGHFEHYAAARQTEHLQQLAEYLLDSHYQECRDGDDPYLSLFSAISRRTAELVAHWQSLGFCHGVLNSDNISVLGLTIDYGPFGMMDRFQMDHICNHSDSQGRYAYHRQPQIMHWNMACLAGGILPLLEKRCSNEEAQQKLQTALEQFPNQYREAWLRRFRAKLGLMNELANDFALIENLLELMHQNRVDFTNTFRLFAQVQSHADDQTNPLRDHFIDRQGFDQWMQSYLDRLKLERLSDFDRQSAILNTNPKFILRNYLAQRAIELAQQDDFSEVQKLLQILENPFAEQPEHETYSAPPSKELEDIVLSCSS
ncbi:YdiU family protein [Polynucleobacter sp. HIN6]|uniref:protein adenylyltransferase SelO n=1 Tax=Polynucleobacter sp. HIN6 TaxID=3047865 RepID=UPI0025727F00|nr:YdiU family protein [Polynucleobacter sp. HIN6]BEI35407.1 YdiU family protein [Polynucleobacter sp. HIN6]